MSQPLSILITGGAGYLGSIMAPALLEEGHRVTVLDNFMFVQDSLNHLCANPNFDVWRGDARDAEVLKPLLRSADLIIPLAALVGAPICDNDKVGAETTNRDAILTLLRLTSREQRIMMPVTNSGYGIGEKGKLCTEDTPLRPISLYGRTKVEAEKAVLDRSNSISFRLATVFGMSPRMRTDLLVNDFVHRAVNDRAVVLFEPHFKRNYIHVRDVARAFIHGIDNFDRMRDLPYNVGLSDANLSKLELCVQINKHLPKFVYLEAPIGEDVDKRDYIVSNERIEKHRIPADVFIGRWNPRTDQRLPHAAQLPIWERVAMNFSRSYPLEGKRVWVAGHTGMVGSALVRHFTDIRAQVLTVSRDEVDLRNQTAVRRWIDENRPDAVFVAAATVGGIEANRTRPAEFLYDNVMIAANIIDAAAQNEVEKLMFLGSSCFYPREAAQPIREDSMLTGPFEPTNEWYAVAKTAGVKLCQAYRDQHGKDFIAVVPTNLFGPGDNFDLSSGHVIPALLRRIHEAKLNGLDTVELWGTGKPLREFLYVEDAAEALVFLMERYSEEAMINVAGGEEVSIAALAALIAEITGYRGQILFDASKPDGMPRKVLDGSRIKAFGWRPMVSLQEGLVRTYEWFCGHVAK